MESFYQENKDAGLMQMAVEIEDEGGDTPSVDELKQWADTYRMTFPVLADKNEQVVWGYAGGGSIGLPYTVLIDRGNVIVSVGSATERDVLALLN